MKRTHTIHSYLDIYPVKNKLNYYKYRFIFHTCVPSSCIYI